MEVYLYIKIRNNAVHNEYIRYFVIKKSEELCDLIIKF